MDNHELEYNTQYIVNKAKQVPGWMTTKELTWLSATANSLSEGSTWLEMGCFCGRSSIAVGLSLPKHSILLLVDRFDPNHKWNQVPWHQTMSKLECFKPTRDVDHIAKPRDRFAESLNYLLGARPDLDIRFYEMSTVECVRCIPEKSCDVIFIDAGHDYQSVTEDCKVADRLIKARGLICGHDYMSDNAVHPQVKIVVDKRYGNTNIIQLNDTSIWCCITP